MKTKLFYSLVLFVIISCVLSFELQSEDIKNPHLLNEISQPTFYTPQPFDVLKYDLLLDLTDYENLKASGVCTISIKWIEHSGEDKFFFHLRSLNVDSVFYQGKRVEAVEAGTPDDADYHYEIARQPEFSTSLIDITVYYSGEMTVEYNNNDFKWGGVHYKNGIACALGVGFHNNYISAAQHWMPCYDHPSDKAKFHAEFIVPAGKAAASNGEMEVHYLDNGTDVYEYSHDFECATYLLTFAVGDYLIYELEGNKVPIVYFTTPADTNVSKFVYQNVPKMLDHYESYYGQYPFEKVGYVNTPEGNMEHQTMIFMESDFLGRIYFEKDADNNIIAHELSHQWFGGMVTPYDFRDSWLNESFAVFSEALWSERLGFENYLNYFESSMKGYFYIALNHEGALSIYDYDRNTVTGNYPYAIYNKGGLVLGMLRWKLGDDVFFKAVRKYLDSLRYGNANTEILKGIFEKESGQDLTQFFNQWIYGIGWPELYVDAVSFPADNGDSIEINLRQYQPKSYGSYLELPLEFGFTTENGEIFYEIFEMNKPEEVFKTKIDGEVVNITLNKGPSLRTLMRVIEINYTGIEENDFSDTSPLVYPNPAEDYIHLGINPLNRQADLSIYNQSGSLVLRRSLKDSFSKIDTKDFPSGIYTLVIKAGEEIWTQKLIIAR